MREMGCPYKNLCFLMWLILQTGKVITSSYGVQLHAPEFGARIRSLSDRSSIYLQSQRTRNESWTTNTPGNIEVLTLPNSDKIPFSLTLPNSTRIPSVSYPYPQSRKETVIRNAKSRQLHSEKESGSIRHQLSHSANPIQAPLNHIYIEDSRAKGKGSSNNGKKHLVGSQNLQFNRIEPFWPFSNISTIHLTNSFKLPKDQNTGFPYNSLPDRFKDTTFFFSHIGPNSFEYRAQFHHGQNEFEQPKFFKPFISDYPEFPKITFPPFPSFPEPPDIFQNKPQLPDFPNLNHVPFPTMSPPIKRILQESIDNPGQTGGPNFEGPFKPYDVVLGDISTKYPKIFRFNEERINIEEFEKEKKLQSKINGLNHNFLGGVENVQRSHLLILHGGIFTVKEPPLYHRKIIRKRRQRFRDGKRIRNS